MYYSGDAYYRCVVASRRVDVWYFNKFEGGVWVSRGKERIHPGAARFGSDRGADMVTVMQELVDYVGGYEAISCGYED